jgi:hypothetical protein
MSAHGTMPAAPRLAMAFLALTLTALLGACSLAPHYDRPEQEMPKQWRSVDMA